MAGHDWCVHKGVRHKLVGTGLTGRAHRAGRIHGVPCLGWESDSVSVDHVVSALVTRAQIESYSRGDSPGQILVSILSLPSALLVLAIHLGWLNHRYN